MRAVELLARVGMKEPELVMKSYPHTLSGGMRQRAIIAMALACNPKLLIADEPTTALDVSVQAQIMELLKRLQKESRMAVLLITHDMGVVSHGRPCACDVCGTDCGGSRSRGAVPSSIPSLYPGASCCHSNNQGQ